MNLLAAFVLLITFVIHTTVSKVVTAENWGSWRGPNRNGISLETALPTKWTKSENILWRTALPGPSGATPVLWGDQIFLTSVDDQDLLLLCFGKEGKEQWRRKIGEGNQNARGDEGNSASPSPITNGVHVWALMGTGDLACFTTSGEEVWKLNLQDQYGKFNIQFGMSSTPVLYENRLFLQLIHGDGNPDTQEAMVIAIDASTGENIWKSGRVTGASRENEHSYSSPILYEFGGLTYLITHGGDYTIAYNLSDGSERWRLGGLNPQGADYHPTLRFVASPAANDGLIVCPTAKNGPVFAVAGDRRGDLTGSDAVRWVRAMNTPDVPSPIIHDGLVYLCRENGMMLVLDQATGDEVYQERTHSHRHRASPVLAGDHVYLTSRDGVVSVLKTGREFELIAQNELGESVSSSPVISDGTIYIRSFDALWAIGTP